MVNCYCWWKEENWTMLMGWWNDVKHAYKQTNTHTHTHISIKSSTTFFYRCRCQMNFDFVSRNTLYPLPPSINEWNKNEWIHNNQETLSHISSTHSEKQREREREREREKKKKRQKSQPRITEKKEGKESRTDLNI